MDTWIHTHIYTYIYPYNQILIYTYMHNLFFVMISAVVTFHISFSFAHLIFFFHGSFLLIFRFFFHIAFRFSYLIFFFISRRIVYTFFFFVMISAVVIQVIFGIIIDSFKRLREVPLCCRVLQCIAICCSGLQCGDTSHFQYLCFVKRLREVLVLQCVAVCCSVLQCVAVCCSVVIHDI